MDNTKLQELLAEKNRQLEADAVRRAHDIIEEIADLQTAKRRADEQIEVLRKELKTLQATQLDPISILG